MADPLSISACIIAILKLTSQAIGYLRNVKDGAGERGRLLRELASLRGVLDSLKDQADEESSEDEGWPLTAQALEGSDGPLRQIHSLLEQLVSRLAPQHGTRRLKEALAWPFRRDEIKEIFSALERCTSYFNMALQNDHM